MTHKMESDNSDGGSKGIDPVMVMRIPTIISGCIILIIGTMQVILLCLLCSAWCMANLMFCLMFFGGWVTAVTPAAEAPFKQAPERYCPLRVSSGNRRNKYYLFVLSFNTLPQSDGRSWKGDEVVIQIKFHSSFD